MATTKVIQSPSDALYGEFMEAWSIFLGGGISNCPDWQSDFAEAFTIFLKKFLHMNSAKHVFL